VLAERIGAWLEPVRVINAFRRRRGSHPAEAGVDDRDVVVRNVTSSAGR